MFRANRLKRGICLALASFVLATFTACSPEATRPRIIAIATLMSHPSLDAVQANLVAELERAGYHDGSNARYVVRNANGDVQLAATIAGDLAAMNPDVLVAITTPMAQAACAAARCPVVFAAVTDPVGAGLIESLETPDTNVTGTSDAWPYEDQLKLAREIAPVAKRIGVLYNPGEAASQYGIARIRAAAPSLGFELVEGAVSSTNDVYAVASGLAGRVDLFFLSSDNTVINGVAAALKVAAEHRLPLIVGDSGTVERGGLAAVSVGYPELGTQTGVLAARVLAGERGIPVWIGRGSEVTVNTKVAEILKVTLPETVVARAAKVYTSVAP